MYIYVYLVIIKKNSACSSIPEKEVDIYAIDYFLLIIRISEE